MKTIDTNTYTLSCGHVRETFQDRKPGQLLYCLTCEAEVKVKS